VISKSCAKSASSEPPFSILLGLRKWQLLNLDACVRPRFVETLSTPGDDGY
jgi:hypothetical protein